MTRIDRARRAHPLAAALAGAALLAAFAPASAGTVLYSNLNVDRLMAAATRPDTPGRFAIETADDFVVSSHATIGHASFIGLLADGATVADIQQVATSIYRIFPVDSDPARPPQVNSRTNTPSDTALAVRSSVAGDLSITVSVLDTDMQSLFSVTAGGIHPAPFSDTGGGPPIRGTEVRIDVSYANLLDLDPDHYFFAPQVAVGHGNFYWLSAAKPITGALGSTPFSPDLQGTTRDAFLLPDWLRVGSDIIRSPNFPAFNFAFALQAQDSATVPEPATWALAVLAAAAAGACRRRGPT